MTDSRDLGEPPPTERSDVAIFVSDASAEADRLSTALRARGYTVVDVPLSLLLARVAVQQPSIILLDVDADGALATAARIRDVPAAASIDFLFIGEIGRALGDPADAARHDGSGFFARPVDMDALLRKVDVLVGGAGSVRDSAAPISPSVPHVTRASPIPDRHSSKPPIRASIPPPSLLPSNPPSSSQVGSSLGSIPIDPWAEELVGPAVAMDIDAVRSSVASAATPSAKLSPEIEQLLRDAEARLGHDTGRPRPPSRPPTPEEEVETVLPAELLEALDDPLDEDDDDDVSESEGSGATPARGTGQRPGSTGGGRTTGASASTTGGGASASERGAAASTVPPHGSALAVPTAPVIREAKDELLGPSGQSLSSMARPTTRPGAHPSLRAPTPLPPPAGLPFSEAPPTADADSITPTPRRSIPVYETGAPEPEELRRRGLPPRDRPSPVTLDPPRARGDEVESAGASRASASDSPAPISQPPTDVRGGGAVRVFAVCIRERATGALCIDCPDGVRRIMLRDGDVVTAASGLDRESLVEFLGWRGDLSRQSSSRLRGKIPAFGRHAGAALVANGHLTQDQLWPTLRAHAEWVIANSLAVSEGTATFEREPPARLLAEPSVFGGATGAEVLIEVLRRIAPPEVAIAHLGGEGATVLPGASYDLVNEAALDDAERRAVEGAAGMTVGGLLGEMNDSGFAATVYALVELGVLEVRTQPTRSSGGAEIGRGGSREPARKAVVDPIDDEALRDQVRARLALVEEGDYFSLLGVGRRATAYEIKRAYLALRRTFEPARALSSSTMDLADDLQLIVEVLDEAFEILRDEPRRERYRRAIEVVPAP